MLRVPSPGANSPLLEVVSSANHALDVIEALAPLLKQEEAGVLASALGTCAYMLANIPPAIPEEKVIKPKENPGIKNLVVDNIYTMSQTAESLLDKLANVEVDTLVDEANGLNGVVYSSGDKTIICAPSLVDEGSKPQMYIGIIKGPDGVRFIEWDFFAPTTEQTSRAFGRPMRISPSCTVCEISVSGNRCMYRQLIHRSPSRIQMGQGDELFNALEGLSERRWEPYWRGNATVMLGRFVKAFSGKPEKCGTTYKKSATTDEVLD